METRFKSVLLSLKTNSKVYVCNPLLESEFPTIFFFPECRDTLSGENMQGLLNLEKSPPGGITSPGVYQTNIIFTLLDSLEDICSGHHPE